MFAAPDPSDIKDVEAQRGQPVQQNAAMYPAQQQNSGGNYPSQQAGSSTVNKGSSMSGGVGSAAPRQGIVSRVSQTLHWGTFVLLIAFLSMMVMIASAQACDDGISGNCVATRGYQVAVGTISLIIALIFGLLDLFGRFSNPGGQIALSIFFFLWWTAAVVVLTFFGDFQSTNTAAGYFSTWFAFIISIFTLVNVSPAFEQGMDSTLQNVRRPLFFLAVASLVAMGASVGPCSPREACVGYNAWAVVSSVASAVVAIVLFFFPGSLERKGMRVVAWLLVFWWIFGVSILTLGGPFRGAGNGFFGVYAALLASCWFAAVVTIHTT